MQGTKLYPQEIELWLAQARVCEGHSAFLQDAYAAYTQVIALLARSVSVADKSTNTNTFTSQLADTRHRLWNNVGVVCTKLGTLTLTRPSSLPPPPTPFSSLLLVTVSVSALCVVVVVVVFVAFISSRVSVVARSFSPPTLTCSATTCLPLPSSLPPFLSLAPSRSLSLSSFSLPPSSLHLCVHPFHQSLPAGNFKEAHAAFLKSLELSNYSAESLGAVLRGARVRVLTERNPKSKSKPKSKGSEKPVDADADADTERERERSAEKDDELSEDLEADDFDAEKADPPELPALESDAARDPIPAQAGCFLFFIFYFYCSLFYCCCSYGVCGERKKERESVPGKNGSKRGNATATSWKV